MITFYECGQGDASYINECGVDLFIDLGTSQFKGNVPSNIDIMISHSHADHVNGGIVTSNNTNINTLYVPAYFPEYAAIINRLLNRPNFPFPNNVKFVYDGMMLCSGVITVLNPPLDPWNYWPDIEDDTPSIDNFLQSLENSIREKDAFVNSIYDDVRNVIRDQISKENSLLFIERMLARLARLYVNGGNDLIYAINSFHNYDANVLSIIFSYKRNDGNVFLFTGDANKEQFYRIMQNSANVLKCNLLKVPHHGSKKSLDKKILGAMSPDAAVISHNNGLFGRAKDPHPNTQVLNILKGAKVAIYPTNDVMKNGSLVISKHRGNIPKFSNVRII